MADTERVREIGFIELMNDLRDVAVGLAPGAPVIVSPEMLSAGIDAAFSAELYPGDHPFAEHVIYRIYVAMERVRIDRSEGRA